MSRFDSDRFRLKRELVDGAEMTRTIRRMAGELIERRADLDNLILVGIHTRGVPLAHRLADAIEKMEGVRPLLGDLDITLYRDDLSTVGPQPLVQGTSFPVSIHGRVVWLCDDVLFTGRTVRAALGELSDYGRPRAVRLAVLVDRGHRELPIQADVVGRKIPTSNTEVVEVGFESVDGGDYVRLWERIGEAP
ncbi:MAG: bifunctional pyr operon transcriptional regulator/uracil phosphoribosyltransferase PyrR [Acidobacteriota bacterium]